MAPHALEDSVPVTTTSRLFQPSSNEQLKPPVSVHSSQQERAPLRTIFPYLELEDHPIDEYPGIKVIVVGAGPAGITAGALLTHKVPGLEIVIYERYDDVGGVWNANIYPGVRCDVPSDVYQATFAPKTTWSSNYARGAEIKAYWKFVADKYNLKRFIKLNHRIVDAEWSQVDAKWVVQVTHNGTTFTDSADFLVTATGHFSDPRLPKYPGIETFEGHLRHTSLWDPNFDPTGKKVALIGNGASGLQVLPQLQKAATHVDHYARSPTWIAGSFGGEQVPPSTSDEREPAPQGPEEYNNFRKSVEAKSYTRFGIIFKNGLKSIAARENFTKLMAHRLNGRTDLLKAVTPEFSPNCRRLTPGPGYLEALAEPNVDYINTTISHITPTGIVTTDGIHREVDAIFCATGADISFTTAFPIYGPKDLPRKAPKEGIFTNLQDKWRPPGFPDSYLGLAAPDYPNLFLLLGPNSTGPGGTLPHSLENQVTYLAKVLRKVRTQGIRTIQPSWAATRDFRAYCESFFPKTVLSEPCSSWYNGGIVGGRIHGIWPGSGTHLNIVRREVRWEDFEYTYKNTQGNRFSYFGNGWSVKDKIAAESQEGEDSVDFSPYLRKEAVDGTLDLRGLHEEWWEMENDAVVVPSGQDKLARVEVVLRSTVEST